MQQTRLIAFYILSLVTIGVLVAWVMSYSSAHQIYRSRWHETDTDYAEKAHWLLTNYGSFGVAWRYQHFDKTGNDLPESTSSHESSPASDSALSHIHALGILPWHWFDYHNESAMHGITPVTNGQLFIPYWSPFLLALLATALVYPRVS